MTEVFVVSDNIISPLGHTSAENFEQLKQSVSAVKRHDKKTFLSTAFYASLFDENCFSNADTHGYTKFEQLLIASIENALQNSDIVVSDKKTILIISSTKGNIGLLNASEYSDELRNRISLNTSAEKIAKHFNFINKPIVVCNACISGSLAMITASRLIRSGIYENAVVAGADVITEFILSGFQSFQALSDGMCRPFDVKRNGINLGEAAAGIVLSSNKKYEGNIRLTGGSVSNDANHISGPSRTGDALHVVIDKAIREAGIASNAIDFISAHGTATLYNDEMEAAAITLSGLEYVPVNSLKAYFGHTLGASGILESVISIHSMQQNIILPSLGFEDNGVSAPVNVCSELLHQPLNHFLKTASGFGGCNAAVVFSK
ncbi:MAG: beta-ketoacyl synthase N-terminal-like domain-containing protein [Ferruginibacter sp.]